MVSICNNSVNTYCNSTSKVVFENGCSSVKCNNNSLNLIKYNINTFDKMVMK